MQANEAIEKLREAAQAVVRQALDDVDVHPCDVDDDNVRAGGLYGVVRGLYDALAATATIDPPAAPVLAAVGVEAQQHSDVIPPSRAAPAGQLDAGDTNWLLSTMDGKDWADEFCRMNNAANHSMMLAWFCNAIMTGYDTGRRHEAEEHARTAGAALGGNTIPEVPAAQPAADHARAAGEREAFEAWANETQQRGPSMDDVWAIYQHGKLAGQQAGAAIPGEAK